MNDKVVNFSGPKLMQFNELREEVRKLMVYTKNRMTPRKLARASGNSLSLINGILNGKTCPCHPVWERIIRVLGVVVEDRTKAFGILDEMLPPKLERKNRRIIRLDYHGGYRGSVRRGVRR